MNNNEMMNEGMETMVEEAVANNGNGLGVGKVALIVAGVGAAVAGVVLVAKKLRSAKAKKDLRQPDEETTVEPEDLEEIAAK